MSRVLRSLRLVHSWLGVLVLPWIVLFGLTGFYLNHERAVLALLPDGAYDESPLRDLRRELPVSQDEALLIAQQYWADQPVLALERVTYHDFLSWRVKKQPGYVLVAIETGHYYVKSNYMRSTYAPDGTRLNVKIYWPYIFGVFHRTGWRDWSLSTIFADIIALSLVGFGLTGLFLWYLPKHKRIRRRILRR